MPVLRFLCRSSYRLSMFQGGMKAVLWADTLQCVIMVAGLVGVIIQGILRVGGIQKIWKIAEDGGRLNFFTEYSVIILTLTIIHNPVLRKSKSQKKIQMFVR